MIVSGATATDYRQAIGMIRFGKRVGTHVYVHCDAIQELPTVIRALATWVAGIASDHAFDYNILKFGIKKPSVSLLHYPAFWHQAFPLLSKSATVDLEGRRLRITDYSKRSNRPVLHRKELLLPTCHSHYQKFSAVTKQAEELGLFRCTQSIGLQKGWRKVLSEKGVRVCGHSIRTQSGQAALPPPSSKAAIVRHRSAIRRASLSQPFQLLQRYAFLSGEYSVFDYGCGHGKDIELLRSMSVDASGWDPHYHPHSERRQADIVNLGFVINVIEDRGERDDVVRHSFALASKVLVVSALIGSPEYSAQAACHADGVITSIGTFQKYFLPDELENYIRELLSVPVTSIAQGVVLAFRSEEEADRFRARRIGLRSRTIQGSSKKAAELYMFDEAARATLSRFWGRCKALGREPLPSELSDDESLEQIGISPAVAYKFLRERMGGSDLEQAAHSRRDELLVQFALGYFDGRVYYKYLAEDVQKDIAEFFGNFSALRQEAKNLLFSIANPENLLNAARAAADDCIGYLHNEQSLELHIDLIERLPKVLRVYVGCAERMLGGLGRADLVKLHLASGKISFMAYDDFHGQSVPFMVERIKVNLWRRRTDFYDYIGEYAPPPLLMKSLFMSEDLENFALQAEFDREALRCGLYDPSNRHPSREEFLAIMKRKELTIDGFRLRQGSEQRLP